MIGNNRIEYRRVFDERHHFIHTVSHRNKIYALDSNNDLLCIYNLVTEEKRLLQLPFSFRTSGSYLDMKIYGNELFIFPKQQAQVIVMDLVTEKVITKKLRSNRLNNDMNHCMVDRYYYIFADDSRKVLRIDLQNLLEEEFVFDNKLERMVQCSFFGESIFFLTEDGRIYKWNMSEEKIFFVVDLDISFPVNKFVMTKQKIIVFPKEQEDKILTLDREKGIENLCNEYPNDFRFLVSKEWPTYVGITEGSSVYVVNMSSSNYSLMIDKESGNIRWIRPSNIKSEIMKMMNEDDVNIWQESMEQFELNDFLQLLESC